MGFGLVHGPGRTEPVPTGVLHSLWHYGKWANLVALLYMMEGVFQTLAAFVRDPTLGIRRLGRRLALSHSLVLLVPLAITVALWVFTTWLGVKLGAVRA